MYCSFFGFREKPFTITPNPRFIFLSKNHKEAFAHLLYGIDGHAGFIELSGEVGTGKTTVLRTLLSQLDGDMYRTALIFNPSLSAIELLRNINHEYGISCDDRDNSCLLQELYQFLLRENAEGRTVVLVIDEAQNLDPSVLEQIRLVSNLETERDKLIQIVLVGQPELREKLKKPELRQLSQRITVRYHLTPMDFHDTVEYIQHRLEVAAGAKREIFSSGALKRIFRYSGGLPRLINVLCDRALLVAYTKGSRVVSAGMTAAAFSDVRKEEPRSRFPRSLAYAVVTCAAVLALFVLYGVFERPTASVKPLPLSSASAGEAASSSLPDKTVAPDLREYLAGKSEGETALFAFNAVARLWGVPGVPPASVSAGPADLEGLAAGSGLNLSRNKGNLGALLRLDCPAILELSLPGGELRYLSLVGTQGDMLIIAPPVGGRTAVTAAELERLWSGRSYFVWKNALNLPLVSRGGDSGESIRTLKSLLSQAGFYKGPLTDLFDDSTLASVKRFQGAQGIEADGVVGGVTLLLLYRAGDVLTVPELVKKGEAP